MALVSSSVSVDDLLLLVFLSFSFESFSLACSWLSLSLLPASVDSAVSLESTAIGDDPLAF